MMAENILSSKNCRLASMPSESIEISSCHRDYDICEPSQAVTTINTIFITVKFTIYLLERSLLPKTRNQNYHRLYRRHGSNSIGHALLLSVGFTILRNQSLYDQKRSRKSRVSFKLPAEANGTIWLYGLVVSNKVILV